MGLVGPGRMDRAPGRCSGSSSDFPHPGNAHSSPGLRESLWLKLPLFNKDSLSDVRSVTGDTKIRKTWPCQTQDLLGKTGSDGVGRGDLSCGVAVRQGCLYRALLPLVLPAAFLGGAVTVPEG